MTSPELEVVLAFDLGNGRTDLLLGEKTQTTFRASIDSSDCPIHGVGLQPAPADGVQ